MRKLLGALGALILALWAMPALATPSFSIGDAQCGVGLHCVFPITKTGAATSYSDVVATSSGPAGASVKISIRFLKAETAKTVAVQGLAPGQFTVTLARARYALIGRGQAIGTVIGAPPPPPPPPPPQLTVQSLVVPENSGSAIVHVIRSGNLALASSASYSTQSLTAISGLNFSDRSGVLSFAPGQADLSFAIPILDDGKVQGDLAFAIALSGFSNATLGANGTVTITNVDVAPPPPPPPPPPPAPPPPAGMAIALQACPALNNGDSLNAGQSYSIVGFAGWSQPGAPPPPAGTKDIAVLNDATHFGDGIKGLWVPRSCVSMQ